MLTQVKQKLQQLLYLVIVLVWRVVTWTWCYLHRASVKLIKLKRTYKVKADLNFKVHLSCEMERTADETADSQEFQDDTVVKDSSHKVSLDKTETN